MIGFNSWLKLSDGVIYGGRGTTVGQNQTQIEFDSVVNSQSGNISMTAKYLFLSVDGISVTNSKGQSQGTTGRNGNYVVGVNYERIYHMHDFDVDWDTFYNVVTDLSIDWNSESASWNTVTIETPHNISWTDSYTDVATSHDYNTMIHGIGT